MTVRASKSASTKAGQTAEGTPAKETELASLRIRAMTNPLRMKIIVALDTEDKGDGVSVSMLARALGMSHGTVFYHVKQLQKAAMIEEIGTREVNGITERFYHGIRMVMRFPPEVAASMDVPVNLYFEETYQQMRKPLGRRSLMMEQIWVDEAERDEFIHRYLELCKEYSTPMLGKMHLGAASVTFQLRDEITQAALAGDKQQCAGEQPKSGKRKARAKK
ncbi:MAG: helix-turn-helix domain-containing protein [Caldisericota bacterium]|jgi:DNA-binding transcriptional ArsR family regulator|nr:helix-turn-helix domain-containing protein [Caldisericota bacterium]